MRRIILVALLAMAACDSQGAPASAGPAPVDDDVSMEDSGSSGSDDESDDESSSGGEYMWDGEVITARTLKASNGWSCESTCGSSACLEAKSASGHASLDCNQPGAGDCVCADDADDAGTPPTHGVSECFADPDGSRVGVGPQAIEPWSGGSCDEYCGDAGLGVCAWTQWIGTPEDSCLPWYGNAWTRQYGEDMTVRPPDGIEGLALVRFVCEI